jgi:hypothetical protein
MKYQPMNEQMSCMAFTSFNKFVCETCFQCMILIHETYKLEWTNFAQFPFLSHNMLSLWCINNLVIDLLKLMKVVDGVCIGCMVGK